MKPVVVFRHACCEGAGYLGTFLAQHAIPWCEVRIDKGEAVPTSVEAYSGIVLMGGPMSVNDALPWIEPVCALIRDAVDRGIPVVGHCLGGQLMSRALGGQVTRNPVKEIGWGTAVSAGDGALPWLGQLATGQMTVFQWHGETFSLPAGATRLMLTPICANQMFVLGPHLGMQCHVEMTPEMIANWCEQWADECSPDEAVPSIQKPEAMQADIQEKLPELRRLADQLYGRWISGLTR